MYDSVIDPKEVPTKTLRIICLLQLFYLKFLISNEKELKQKKKSYLAWILGCHCHCYSRWLIFIIKLKQN